MGYEQCDLTHMFSILTRLFEQVMLVVRVLVRFCLCIQKLLVKHYAVLNENSPFGYSKCAYNTSHASITYRKQLPS